MTPQLRIQEISEKFDKISEQYANSLDVLVSARGRSLTSGDVDFLLQALTEALGREEKLREVLSKYVEATTGSFSTMIDGQEQKWAYLEKAKALLASTPGEQTEEK